MTIVVSVKRGGGGGGGGGGGAGGGYLGTENMFRRKVGHTGKNRGHLCTLSCYCTCFITKFKILCCTFDASWVFGCP